MPAAAQPNAMLKAVQFSNLPDNIVPDPAPPNPKEGVVVEISLQFIKSPDRTPPLVIEQP